MDANRRSPNFSILQCNSRHVVRRNEGGKESGWLTRPSEISLYRADGVMRRSADRHNAQLENHPHPVSAALKEPRRFSASKHGVGYQLPRCVRQAAARHRS